MSSCEHFELMLPDYAVGELSATDVASLEEHLDSCHSCRTELAYDQEMRQTLGTLPTFACPDRVSATIVQQMDNRATPPQKQNNRRSPWFWLQTGSGLAAAAVLLAIFLPLGEPDNSQFVDGNQQWTQEELRTAKNDLKWTLALAARVIDQTEKSTVADVFGHKVPEAINWSLENAAATRGGDG